MRRNNKKGKLPRKRQFTLVLHRKNTRGGVLYAPFACVPVVQITGVEPARGYQWILNPSRLPIPPYLHFIYSFPLRLSYPRPTKIFRRARFVKVFVRVFL